MKKVYADSTITISKGDFDKPKNFDVELDCEKYNQQQKQHDINFDDFNG
jgi:hypothetical protein